MLAAAPEAFDPTLQQDRSSHAKTLAFGLISILVELWRLAELPETLVVLLLDPAVSVLSTEVDERLGELAREEHIAEQLGVECAVAGVEKVTDEADVAPPPQPREP